MTLDEAGRGRADRDDEIDRSTRIKRAKIFYKQGFGMFIILPGIHQQVIETSTGFSPCRLISERMDCA